jgi:hypothetical protein
MKLLGWLNRVRLAMCPWRYKREIDMAAAEEVRAEVEQQRSEVQRLGNQLSRPKASRLTLNVIK